MDKLDVLKNYFGYHTFREGQGELIDAVLRGQDCLGVMPTGAGKSLCFQIPAILLNGTAIVISPLISLMQDQINALNQSGIPAVCINSAIDEYGIAEIYQNAAHGLYKIIYAAPERLLTPRFQRLCENLTIPLVAVDEAHCVSQWGQDFRPSYLNIPKFVQSVQSRPVIAAFTATATNEVKRDIVRILDLQHPFSVTTGYDRPNLYFEVRRPKDKDAELLGLLRNHSGSAIVYCSTRRNVESVGQMLLNNGIRAGMYHAGFSSEERRRAQQDFIFDRVSVMVATNAFGMGIDKSNVSLVVHYNMPLDVESYYQEAGRAGRDGSDARCVLLYGREDTDLARFLIDHKYSDNNYSDREAEKLRKLDLTRLGSMEGYCDTKRCLRGYILNYFGEMSEKSCGNCSNCSKGLVVEDVTIDAQKVLSCIFRAGQRGLRVNVTGICGILHGDTSEPELQQLSTFGIMRETPLHRIVQIARYLSSEGYFTTSDTDGCCVLTEKSDRFIKSKSTIIMRFKAEKPAAPAKSGEIPNPELYERLSALRKKLAGSLGVPPYVVFSNASLVSMCAILPTDIDSFLRVDGVGIRKAERYGRKFMSEIVGYLNARQK